MHSEDRNEDTLLSKFKEKSGTQILSKRRKRNPGSGTLISGRSKPTRAESLEEGAMKRSCLVHSLTLLVYLSLFFEKSEPLSQPMAD
jgi:hypothetical protein